MKMTYESRKRLAFEAGHPRTGDHAFSLVEVTLALGIVSFCLLALMGLLSVGLSASRDASNHTIVPHIVEQVVAQVRQTLPPPSAGMLIEASFDNEGQRTTQEAEAIYTVECLTKPTEQTDLLLMEVKVAYQGVLKRYYATCLGVNAVSGGEDGE